MHELSLMQGVIGLIEAAQRQDGFSRVTAVTLAIGALSHVEPQALRFGFESAARGTLADGAALNVETVPGTAYCFDCAAEVALESRASVCPVCGRSKLLVTAGDEMRLKHVEVV